jgi:hypothetical protein
MTEAAGATTRARILAPLEVRRASGIAMTAGREVVALILPDEGDPDLDAILARLLAFNTALRELIYAMQTDLGVEGEPPPPAPLQPSQEPP